MYQKALLSEKIAESIVIAIKNGFYKIGDQMPNEIQLSEELGVSRATLREAIKNLISKNILEVRRGIGTFVSPTPGYSVEVAGLEFLDLPTQIIDILRTMRYFDSEELAAYKHLSYDSQRTIAQYLAETERMPIAMIHALLGITEQIALFRNSTFRNRMISLSHEAFKKAMPFNFNASNSQLTGLFEALMDAMGDESVMAHYDDFIMRIRLLAQEG